MIVRDKVVTMTTIITTTQIFINLNNLPAKCKPSLRHIYHEILACVYIFHENPLKCVFLKISTLLAFCIHSGSVNSFANLSTNLHWPEDKLYFLTEIFVQLQV